MRTPSAGILRSPRSRTGRGGFTLAEIIVSVMIISIVMVALSSAIMLASKALPDSAGGSSALAAAGRALDNVVADIRLALSVSESTSTSLTFTVQDQNGDGLSETIRYAWSGVAGAPLTRQFNGGAAVEVAQGVQDFDLTYNVLTVVTYETVTTTTTSDEVLFACFDGWPGDPGSSEEYDVNSSDWIAEYFKVEKVVLPAETSKVTITRAQLSLMADDDDSAFTVGIHRSASAGGPMPAASPLGTPIQISPATLGASFIWRDVVFADVSVNERIDEFVIVVKGLGADSSAVVEYLYSNTAPQDAPTAIWTSNAGGSWKPNVNQRRKNDVRFYVYGTYEFTSTQQVPVTNYLLQSTRIRLRTSTETSAGMETMVDVLNQPQVDGP